MIDLASADKALKSFYLDAVAVALNTKINPFLAKIEKTSTNIVGKDIRKAVTAGYHSGVGSSSEMDEFPTAKDRQFKELKTTLKNFYGSLQITDKAVRVASGQEGEFVNILNEEMQALVDSSKFNFGRMLFGDGSGRLSKVMSYSNNTCIVDNIQNFAVGMEVMIEGDANIFNDMTVIDIDYERKKVYLGGAGTSNEIANEPEAYIYPKGCVYDELTGLKAIFDNEQLYGLSRNGIGMKPYKLENVGDIDETIIQKAMDSVEAASGLRPNYIICSWGVRRALQAYYKEHNMALPTIQIEGGFTALDFYGVPIVVDRFCQEGTMYILNTDCFKLYQLCDWQWMEAEDGKILKQIPCKPVYTATLVKYAELLCDNPSAQARLTGITTA